MADSNSLAVGWEWLVYWFIIWKVHPSLSFCLKRNVQNTFVYKSKCPDPQILRHKHRRLINQVCSFNNIKVPSGPVLGEATASALQNIIGWFQNTTKKTHDKFYPFPWIWFKRNVIADAHWCTQSSDRGVISIPGSKVFFFFAWVEIKPGLKNWGPKLSRRQQILSCLCSNFGNPQSSAVLDFGANQVSHQQFCVKATGSTAFPNWWANTTNYHISNFVKATRTTRHKSKKLLATRGERICPVSTW